MTKLRKTRSDRERRPTRAAGQGLASTLALGFGFGLIGILGCGQESRDVPADPAAPEPALVSERPLMEKLAPPRSEWIDYSARDRKLTLYNLPSSGRWMVKRPDRDTAYPVGPEHILPEGINPTETMVYYMRPSGQISRSVSLAQILAARDEHVSIAR